jgi:hypothetical protein
LEGEAADHGRQGRVRAGSDDRVGHLPPDGTRCRPVVCPSC